MGCCLSTKNPQTTSSKPHLRKSNSPSSSPKRTPHSRAPPPTHPEEETVVKEVLSETPISRIPELDSSKDPLELSLLNDVKLHQNDAVLEEPKKPSAPEELTEEVSEICSTLSESCVSTATTATTATAATAEMNNAADDDNEVTQIRKRRVAKDRLVSQKGQRPQNRRSEALPGRVRSEASPGRVRPGLRDGRGQGNNGMRRGSVMGPERRSRSPVTRVDGPGLRSGLGRCPSGRRTGRSPGRFGPPEVVEKNVKVERVDPKVENGDTEPKLDHTNDESLENPHVSLECFIFL